MMNLFVLYFILMYSFYANALIISEEEKFKGNGSNLFQYDTPEIGDTERLTLTGLDLNGSYGDFPGDKGVNGNWTDLKTAELGADNDVIYVKVSFKMVKCITQGRRCGKAKVEIYKPDYEMIGSPVSGYYQYSKIHWLPKIISRDFKFYSSAFPHWVSVTDKKAKTLIKDGLNFAVVSVCFSGNEGEESCLPFSTCNLDLPNCPGQSSVEFPVVKVGTRIEKDLLYSYLHQEVFLNDKAFLELNSPDVVSFRYYRYKNSREVSGTFVESDDFYYFEITDKKNTVFASDHYTFTLFTVCFKGRDKCVQTSLNSGSYSNKYKFSYYPYQVNNNTE